MRRVFYAAQGHLELLGQGLVGHQLLLVLHRVAFEGQRFVGRDLPGGHGGCAALKKVRFAELVVFW